MSSDLPGLPTANGLAVRLADVPVLAVTAFHDTVVDAVRGGARLVTLFGARRDGATRAYAVLANDAAHRLAIMATHPGDAYPALTPDCPQAHFFERELHEQLGVMPEGHPWLKPVRAGHEPDSTYRYFAMAGSTIHEVAVGPVHAGVIEPGHFRFQCDGEVVHHLEIHLGYQHRGVEAALIGGPHPRTPLHVETVAGDTSVANAVAYAQVIEALAGVEPSPRGQAVRTVALELERLANHVGDIGALAGDVGYLPAAAYAGRLRGDFLNMTTLVCGSRMGRNWVRPGGVAFDLTPDLGERLLDALERAAEDARRALDLYFSTASLTRRLRGTGTVPTQTARDLGLVGVAARASGVSGDARRDHPTGWHRGHGVEPSVVVGGDVYARSMVRKLEIERSLAYVREQLSSLPAGPAQVPCPPRYGPESLVVSMCEGWRGEVVHIALTDADGTFARYKLTDPSFHNWTALALAMRGQQISDFPLCNKSFNLSYCGFDL